MHHVNHFVSILILFSIPIFTLAGPPAGSQSSAAKYIRDSESQWAESVTHGNMPLVQRILADDFVGVDVDGSHYDKTDVIARAKAAHGDFISNHLEQVTIRFFGDAAVAQGSEVWEKRTGEPRHGRFVWTDTWVRRGGYWQIVAAEDLIPPLPPPQAKAKP